MVSVIELINKILGRASDGPPEPFQISFPMSAPMAEFHRLHLEKRHRAFVAQEAIDKAKEAIKEAGAKLPMDLPKDHPAYVAYMKANSELSATWDYAKARFAALGAVIPKDEMERWHTEWLDFQYRPDNAEDPHEHVSPSGKYKLVVTRHPSQPGIGERSLGRVFKMGSDTPVIEVRRNYRSFPFAWVEEHPHNQHDYLLCGENYQGQTLVDLTLGTKESTLPSMAGMGFGFCWADIQPSPDKKTLAVEGCFWAAPYECVFYDFTVPRLPVLELQRFDYDDFHGWNDDGTASLTASFEVRKSDGKRYYDMTEEEQDTIPSSELEYKKESITWSRPSYFEVAKRLGLTLARRIDDKFPFPKEWADEFDRLMGLLTNEEQNAVREYVAKER
jgi:hypothetical protein